MTYKNIAIKKPTEELLSKCREEYYRLHKDMREIPLSNNKIIFEIAKYYLET